ncbi:MAG: Flp family type IVb pilin [Hyphomonadaceae bacterium]
MMQRFAKHKSGATAIEYSLIAAFIGLVIVSALGVVGQKTAEPYNNVAAAL